MKPACSLKRAVLAAPIIHGLDFLDFTARAQRGETRVFNLIDRTADSCSFLSMARMGRIPVLM
jgi:hypothetical protein